MNFYDIQRFGVERTVRFHKEAAVGAIARASGTPHMALAAARVLRRLAESIDQSQPSAGTSRAEVAQPTVLLALTEA